MLNKFNKTLSILLFFTLLPSSFAIQLPAEKVEFLAGLPKPPFIIKENESGIQLDIIKRALSSQNINVDFRHVPLGRNVLNFRKLDIDAVSIIPSDYSSVGMFVSKPYITYQNVAVSLSDREISVETISDLSDFSTIAFQNAKKFLGDEFKSALRRSVGYREMANQLSQIDMLFTGRTELIVLDINIFLHFFRENQDNPKYNKLFKIHYIFDERHYAAGFKTLALKQKFDNGIAKIKESGEYQEILNKYL